MVVREKGGRRRTWAGPPSYVSLGELLGTFERGRDRPKLWPVPRRETFPFGDLGGLAKSPLVPRFCPQQGALRFVRAG